REQAEKALLAGAQAVLEAEPCDVLALGEVGIGNTTAASALLALLTDAEARDVVGTGTGVGSTALDRKTAVIEQALRRCRARDLDPLDMLAEVGGFEIAALVGGILAGAGRRIPVLLDGFMVAVAALIAARLAPPVTDYLLASHRSAEPGHRHVLECLGLRPLLELELRLGEGSGAVLALPLLDAACAVLRDVRTFREAGIDEPVDERGLR
ncbi:MAG: nicotinate-nucleotide--dimethylbenzimidazole phosphoribosyltransferase, partial [Gemmatimonadota bacterium]|nr:nicotinate-nucleotide--dimethylbenzimidazole phosphoribosyltransferase [Gemmatimonadota bacterium]